MRLCIPDEAPVHPGSFDDASGQDNETLVILDEKISAFLKASFIGLRASACQKFPGQIMVEAEACLNQAVTISRKQGAKSMGLRAAMIMAREWEALAANSFSAGHAPSSRGARAAE